MTKTTLVVITTYQEALNIGHLIDMLLTIREDLEVLVVDDSSPDGTADVVRSKMSSGRVHLLLRPGKLGIGGAQRDGIFWAYERGYSRVATMDADLTHSPADLVRVLDNSEQADVVVASRFVSSGSLPGWNLWRRALTHAGHVLTRVGLRLPYDATGALRAYRLDRIPRRIFELATSNGYSFIFESLLLIHVNGYIVREVPVVLPARILGSSKMTLRELRRSVSLIFSYFLVGIFEPERLRISNVAALSSPDLGSDSREAWEDYWSARLTGVTLFYDILAGFYRRWLIRPPFERSIRRNFSKGARLLHAGCGSGHVDVSLAKDYSIAALDHSRRALEIYLAVNGAVSEVCLGTIEALPYGNEEFDGVYNLGVMEHLPRETALRVLREFHRVLKPGGKLHLWWPPEYGFSVKLLKVISGVTNAIGLGSEEKPLFPEECSRIRERGEVAKLLGEAGFSLNDFRFGMADLYTQVEVCAVKA